MGLLDRLSAIWVAQHGALFPWVPVAFACGIGIFFSLRTEPASWFLVCCGLGALCCAFLAARVSYWVAPLIWCAALVALGFAVAGARAHLVAAPILDHRYYGPVEGRVIGIDRSSSDALRLRLDRVVLSNMAPAHTPARVRVALHGSQDHFSASAGDIVMMTAHLAPPSGPVEPEGFDFQRHAWFQQLGAVGYTRTPMVLLEPAAAGQATFKLRMWLSARVQAALPGERGAFAAAIMTGDRSEIGQATLVALRVSNLAHLLAISGLHMGLLAGFVFGALRLGFALIPHLALRYPIKKFAAVGAILAAAGYLALSGGNVATERAFVMVSVMLSAILLDRRVFSLRAVALAALIVLGLRPEALLSPGFQMSFAATTALVAVFSAVRDFNLLRGPTWLRPVQALVLSSFVAGLATAPIAAAHFNQIAHFGLVANLLSVPLMGVLVMPAAVLAACLLPFGLEGVALWLMGQGLAWILQVAHAVSGLEGARGMVLSPDDAVLPLLALGALFVFLWQGWSRVAGIAPIIAAIAIWVETERPEVLIADNGALVGVLTPMGRALNREVGGGFVARNWLENDGDPADQAEAYGRWAMLTPQDWPVLPVRGKGAVEALEGCQGAEWLVVSAEPDAVSQDWPCRILSPETLQQSGAVALFDREGALELVSARQVNGTRIWNP